jgi:hypothetical protein
VAKLAYFRPTFMALTLVIAGVLANRMGVWLADQLSRPASVGGSHAHVKTEAFIDVGEVWESPECVLSVPFRNPSPAQTSVDGVGLSCSCTKLQPTSFDIPSNAVFEAKATVDLTHRSPDDLDRPTRPLDLAFTPRGDRQAMEPVRIRGTIRSRVTANRLDLHFGDACVKGSQAVTRSLVATVHVPARSVIAAVEPPVAKADVARLPGSEAKYLISVTPM